MNKIDEAMERIGSVEYLSQVRAILTDVFGDQPVTQDVEKEIREAMSSVCDLAGCDVDCSAEVVFDVVRPFLGKSDDRLKTVMADQCETDTAIRNIARPVLGNFAVDGDSNGIPALEDIVETLVGMIRSDNQLERLKDWLTGSPECDMRIIITKDGYYIYGEDINKKIDKLLAELPEPVKPFDVDALEWWLDKAQHELAEVLPDGVFPVIPILAVLDKIAELKGDRDE
jgi:hypothetical protein